MATHYPDYDRDKFYLHNALKLSELHPNSFHIPSPESRCGIEAGAVVKLSFCFADPEGSGWDYDTERMWVIATERFDDHWIGELNNHPYYNPGVIEAGALFHFHPDHIIAIE